MSLQISQMGGVNNVVHQPGYINGRLSTEKSAKQPAEGRSVSQNSPHGHKLSAEVKQRPDYNVSRQNLAMRSAMLAEAA